MTAGKISRADAWHQLVERAASWLGWEYGCSLGACNRHDWVSKEAKHGRVLAGMPKKAMLRNRKWFFVFLMQPFGISMTLCGKGKVLDNNKIHMSCVIKILLDTGYFI